MSLEDRRAVLLGVTGTSSSEFEPLPSAERDVKALERVLEMQRDGSTPNFDVKTSVVDETSEWGVGDLLHTIDLELGEASHLLFYFSGHGHVTEFGLELITPEKTHALDSGVYFDVLLHRFNTAPTDTEITVILDCCFSGAAGDSPLHGGDVLRRFTHLRDGITILASSRREQPSYAEDDGMSDFTKEVVECLEENQPRTDILDLYKWTRERVPDQVPVLRTFGSRHSALRVQDKALAESEGL